MTTSWPLMSGGQSATGEDLRRITLSASVIEEGSAAGTLVGTLAVINSLDVWSFILTEDASDKFAIVGSNLVAGATATDFETSESELIIVFASNGVTSFTRAFNIAVTDLVEGPTQEAPLNVDQPAISGLAARGQTLTAVPGDWTGTPTPDLSYQWQADGVDIPGATNSTYVLALAQDETVITVVETASNTLGSGTSESEAIGPVSSGIAQVTPLFIRTVAAGTKDGSSWANAAAITSLDAALGSLPIDGVIMIRADEGDYTIASTINIAHGGTSGHPKTIRGVDVNLANMEATFVGNRTAWTPDADPDVLTNVTGWTVGVQPFKLIAGYHDVTWRYLRFERFGTGCFRHAAAISRVTYDHITFENVQTFIENTFSSPATSASVTGLTITNCEGVGFSKRCVRVRYDSSDITISNCDFDSHRQTHDNFAVGIEFNDTAHDAIVTSVTCYNCHDTQGDDSGAYWNGDGFSSESTNYDIAFVDCVGSGCTDAAFDCKGGTTFLRCTGDDNKRNFRLWGNSSSTGSAFLNDQTLTDCISTDPHLRGGTGTTPCHIYYTHSADVLIDNLTATDTNAACAVYLNEDGPCILRIISDTISTLGTEDVHSGSTLVLDASAADSTAPTITSAAAASVNENAAFAATLTATDAHAVTWSKRATSADDTTRFTLDLNTGALAMAAKDFEVPLDRNADNVYICRFACRDLRRNETISTVSVTILDVGGEVAVAARYIAPTAAGTQSGDSWANAASLSQLNQMIGLAAAVLDAPVYIAADLGNYTISTNTVTITNGGTVGHPVVIQGVNSVGGAAAKPTFVGNRTSWTLPVNPETTTSVSGWTVGGKLFLLDDGADYLTFKNMTIQRCEKPFAVVGICTGVTIEDIDCYNTREGVHILTGDLTAGLIGFIARRVTAIGFSKKFYRVAGASDDWQLLGFDLNSGRQTGDNFACCIAGDDAVCNVVIDGTAYGYGGTLKNTSDVRSADSYWNADGISGERDNDNWTISNITATGHTDAGLDTKGSNWTLTNCVFSDSKRNVRLWFPDVIFEGCTISLPNRRGGTGGTANLFLIGKHSTWLHAADVCLRDCTIQFSSSNPAATTDSGDYDNIARFVDGNTLTNATIASINNDSDGLLITCADNLTAPVVTHDVTTDIYGNQTMLLHLTADKGVSWAITGGADAALFIITNSAGATRQTGQYLRLGPQTFGADNVREVELTAKDANLNETVFTQTVTILAGAPAATLDAEFEGANGATAYTTIDAGARTVTFVGGAAISTSAPLAGTSSLSLSGANQRCSIADSTDWYFSTGQFTIKAKIVPTGFVGSQTIISQYVNSTGNRGWELILLSTGALQFTYTTDGSTAVNLATPAGVVTAGTHEVMVDRDSSNVVRIYVDGVMAVKATVTANIANVAQSLSIGNNGSLSRQFTGKIDAVKIWKGYFFCGSDAGYTP